MTITGERTAPHFRPMASAILLGVLDRRMLTYQEASNITGFPSSVIGAWSRGTRQPRFATLMTVLELLGEDPFVLVAAQSPKLAELLGDLVPKMPEVIEDTAEV